MALKPLSREELQKLYDVSEPAHQQRVQDTIHSIYASVITYATKVSTTSYTYQLSKIIYTPESSNDIFAGIKLAFPDSSVTLANNQHSYALVIDWSPLGAEERSEAKP